MSMPGIMTLSQDVPSILGMKGGLHTFYGATGHEWYIGGVSKPCLHMALNLGLNSH